METMTNLLTIAMSSDNWLKPARYKEAEKFFYENGYDENGEVLEEFADEIREFVDNVKNWDFDEFEIFDQNFDWSDIDI